MTEFIGRRTDYAAYIRNLQKLWEHEREALQAEVDAHNREVLFTALREASICTLKVNLKARDYGDDVYYDSHASAELPSITVTMQKVEPAKGKWAITEETKMLEKASRTFL
jgi:hypothetical protein